LRVKLVDIAKQFGPVTAIDSLSLEIGDGELVALLGPSGCGKTTALMLLAGFYRPNRGHILFDDQPVDGMAPRDRGVGMVFQSYALYPHMTVAENIAFPLVLQKVPAAEQKRRCTEMAERCRIGHLLGRRPEELSGGQQQRTALARALVKRPGLLLLDEPLSNLDARLRTTMREEIRLLQQELKVTTVLVTHDQEEAMTMADRIALMTDGTLQQFDPPTVLYNRPLNRFAAYFIGTPPMNLIEVDCRPNAQGLHLVGPGADLRLPDRFHVPPGPLTLGIRPHDLQLTAPEQAPLHGVVTLLEHLGRETLIHARVGETTVRVFGPADLYVERGKPIGLVPNPDRLYLFDPDSGKVVDHESWWESEGHHLWLRDQRVVP
jgi:ABC-type sugar transport system ATPase subunit